jgi:pimeloyl-ACP methyl ester carboxylesterase
MLAVAIGLTLPGSLAAGPERPASDTELGIHGFAKSGEVRIHYVTKGSGPLVVLVHGFPDFWYTWRRQMPALAKTYQVVAIDQRGYNESDQPKGVENYTMEKLVGDVVAVIKHFKRDRATVVGHDWGGAVAWSFAMTHPEMTDRLVILNLPHPLGLMRELANNPEQRKNSAYAREFQKPGAASRLTAGALAAWVKDPAARAKYVEAFRRSSFEGMLNYYKANYPRASDAAQPKPMPKVKCPVLLFHGLKDKALLASALNNTWEWVDNELTLVTIPTAGHFVQQDAPGLVTERILGWLSTGTSGRKNEGDAAHSEGGKG